MTLHCFLTRSSLVTMLPTLGSIPNLSIYWPQHTLLCAMWNFMVKDVVVTFTKLKKKVLHEHSKLLWIFRFTNLLRQPLKSPTNTWGIDVDLCYWLLQNMWTGDSNADFQTGRHIQKTIHLLKVVAESIKFSKIPRTAESAQGWQQTLRQRTEWNSIYTLHVHRRAVREVDRAGGEKTQVQSRQRKWKGSQIRLKDTNDLFCLS